MMLAFSRPTAGPAEQRELFSLFRTAGFEGLQLKGGQYSASIRDPARFREEWGSDSGIVSALITGGTLDSPGIAALRQVIAFASAVRSERIVFCHGASRSKVTPADLREYARILGDLALEARQSGIALSLHHHYDQPVMRRQDFDHFFAATPTRNVGLTLDTAHLVKSGITDIAGMILDFRQVLDNMHLKDFAQGEFQVLGTGGIDFDPVLAALREIGYDGWLCADEESGADIRGGLDASFRFIRQRIGSGAA
jgi:inosose dehydratase